jgi:hypothetical protein
MNGSKHLQKHFLCQIPRVIPVLKKMVGKFQYHPVVLGDKQRARILITRRALPDQPGLPVGNIA